MKYKATLLLLLASLVSACEAPVTIADIWSEETSPDDKFIVYEVYCAGGGAAGFSFISIAMKKNEDSVLEKRNDPLLLEMCNSPETVENLTIVKLSEYNRGCYKIDWSENPKPRLSVCSSEYLKINRSPNLLVNIEKPSTCNSEQLLQIQLRHHLSDPSKATKACHEMVDGALVKK